MRCRRSPISRRVRTYIEGQDDAKARHHHQVTANFAGARDLDIVSALEEQGHQTWLLSPVILSRRF